MANPFYSKTFDVAPGAKVLSQSIEDQFLLVEQGFDGVNTSSALKGSANTFTAANIFNAVTTFNALATLTAGITVSGTANFTGATLSIAAPVNASDAATKAYVDANVSAAGASPLWVSGTTYASGVLVYSPANFQTYRRITAGAGTTDPSLDTTNWTVLGLSMIPQNSKSAAYTLVLADAGFHILHPSADTTARIFTIPANSSVAYPIGTAITFVNQSGAGTLTISITTDTMRLAQTGTTGSRTLVANGVATAIKLTATEWIISGMGLS